MRLIPLEWRLGALVFTGALPALALIVLIALFHEPAWVLWTSLGAALTWTAVLAVYASRRSARSFERISGLVHSVREGEYGMRARRERGSYGRALEAVNLLSSELAGLQRAGIESDALLGKLLSTLDLAILVFDPAHRLTGANAAALQLLGGAADTDVIGHTAEELNLEDWLESTAPQRESRHFPGGEGPWEARMARFRRGGRSHSLLVITDLSQALREEERRAWRGLIRVLAHEASNSLGPIQSAADTLNRALNRGPGNASLRDELGSGLALIERRARYLSEFIRRYADLARLPPPQFASANLGELLQRVATLETRVTVHTDGPAHLPVRADPAQLEQALINLVKNAADAALETDGAIELRWRIHESRTVVEILDEGHGLPESENLFVPFFTTKPGGSGIGLVLARQIIEAHGGTLVLANREDTQGAVARLRLPAVTS
ncbi:MAG TPA: ATP-binding protein [Gammaproteobacteria bacterium]|nr:ATP-binding protein [Gammaproteobacteria bacterium]